MLPSATVFAGGDRDVDSSDSQCPGSFSSPFPCAQPLNKSPPASFRDRSPTRPAPSLPGVTVEARNLDTNFGRTLVTEADGRFVFLQLAPGNYRMTFTLAGFATHIQENIVLTVGQVGHPAGRDEGIGRVGNSDGHDRDRRHRNVANRVGDDAESEHDRDHPDPGPEVRGSADADAGRRRSSRGPTATRSASPGSAASSTTSASTAATTTTGSSASRRADSARRSTSRSTRSRSSR